MRPSSAKLLLPVRNRVANSPSQIYAQCGLKIGNKCNIIDWKILRWDFLLSYFLVCTCTMRMLFSEKKSSKMSYFVYWNLDEKHWFAIYFSRVKKYLNKLVQSIQAFGPLGHYPFGLIIDCFVCMYLLEWVWKLTWYIFKNRLTTHTSHKNLL